MGYQQFYLKFNNLKALQNELIIYKKRDKSNDQAKVFCAVEVLKNVAPFKKGEVALVVGGERWEQRNKSNLKEGLGIGQVKEIMFIDNYYFNAKAQDMELGEFLDSNFRTIEEDEYEKYGIVNPFN